MRLVAVVHGVVCVHAEIAVVVVSRVVVPRIIFPRGGDGVCIVVRGVIVVPRGVVVPLYFAHSIFCAIYHWQSTYELMIKACRAYIRVYNTSS